MSEITVIYTNYILISSHGLSSGENRNIASHQLLFYNFAEYSKS
jgi:hypothetical protein